MDRKSKAEPLVSIIMPMYNAKRFIEDTINSIRSQTYQNWELLITDDKSNDGSINIVKAYMKEDNRIKLRVLEENRGGAVARNTSIRDSKGKYIAFLDSDDIWKREKLKKQIKFMESNNYKFTYTNYELMSEDGVLLNKKRNPELKLNYVKLLKANQIGCLTVIYNAEELGKIYMPLIKKRQDYALWLQILKKTEYAYCLNENLGKYRLVRNSVSSKKINLIKYNWSLFRKIEGMSLLKAGYYLMWNIVNKIIK